MLYAIWQPLPRPLHFPQDPKLDSLLASNFDPRLDYFELRMFRRNARDLRKGIFGPKGLRDVPKDEGVRRFDLPNGWTLWLTYGERPDDWREAGDVVAKFVPPGDRRGHWFPPQGHRRDAEEARP